MFGRSGNLSTVYQLKLTLNLNNLKQESGHVTGDVHVPLTRPLMSLNAWGTLKVFDQVLSRFS